MHSMPECRAQPISNRAKARRGGCLRELWKNRALLAMMIPGLVVLFLNHYLPLGGIVIAFQRMNFRRSAFMGDWVGLKNFEFFFRSTAAGIITRNTLLYNLVFIVLGLVVSVAFAIALNEITNHIAGKFYQTVMFLPYFMSWIVISYIVFAIFGNEHGLMNSSILQLLGKDPVNWYMAPRYWPAILITLHIWKGAGYGSVMYLAAIINIDTAYYEAARIDGANKWQQIRHITLPMLKPMMIILTLLAVGKIFNSDFGLFYTVPMNSGGLYDVTSTIDTYVYRTMATGAGSNFNLSAAAGLFQSCVGFVCVMLTNWIVRKIESDYALF